jgi:DNA invertase Pin-like site-specific DNA recombinase
MAGRNVGSRSGENDAAWAASAQDGGSPQVDAQVNRAAEGPGRGLRVGARAVVYVRISDDPQGLERGVDRQEADCRALAGDLGLDVVSVFRENDVSAFKQRTVTLPSGERVRRVVRPRFRAMLALLADGGADVMVAYDLDRAVRDPRDLEDLVDARTLHGFKVRSVTGSLRLDTDSDVAMARVLVAMANKSSADTARRVARASRQQALEGRWHGGAAPFGYNLEDGSLVVDGPRAVLAREAATRVAGGESPYAVARDWNRRGLSAPGGGAWGQRAVTRFLRNPALKGTRVYRPLLPDGSKSKDPELVTRGGWEPIVDEDLWAEVNTVLDRRREAGTVRSGPVKRVHPFTGLIRCARCGVAMNRRGSQYKCDRSLVGSCSRSVDAREVTALVEDAVLSVFARIAANPAPPAASPSADGGAVAGLRVLVEADQRALAELDDDRYDGLVDKATWVRQRARLSARIDERRREWQGLLAPEAVAGGIDAATVAAQWADRPVGWRHAAASVVLEAVLVHAHPAGVAAVVSRRRGEDDADYRARLAQHRQGLLARRIEFTWRA